MVGVEEVLAAGAVAAAIAINDDEKKSDEPTNKPAVWQSGSIIASYEEGGRNFSIEAQTGKKGTVVQDLYRMKIKGEDRYPDPDNPGNLLFQPSNFTYTSLEEITNIAQTWVESIPESTPPGPVGPQNPQPLPPGRPQLPDTGGVRMGSQFSNPEDFNIDDLRKAGRFGDTELVHVNQDEIEMLKKQGGSGSINPKTGLQEFYVPAPPSLDEWREYQEAVESGALTQPESPLNLDDSIQNQITAFINGQESCFDMASGQGWQYVAGGKVLVLDDDDNFGLWGIDSSSGTLTLRIAQGYRLQMVIGIDSGVFNIGTASGVRGIFDEQYIKTGNPNIGAFVDARISEEYALVPMRSGDSIQIDVDGVDGSIGDFRVVSTGETFDATPMEITDSYAVNNDVQLAIDKNSVRADPNTKVTTEDEIQRRATPDKQTAPKEVIEEREDLEMEQLESGEGGRSPVVLGLGLLAVGIAVYFMVFAQTGSVERGMKL